MASLEVHRSALAHYRAQIPPRFLITGSGRSATRWTAYVLTNAGLLIGHEGWWGIGADDRVSGLDGDVSWMGCFDDGFAGDVYLQVRDPRLTIPSIYSSEFCYPWLMVRQQNVRLTGDWAVDACRIWLEYNRHAYERAKAWWRVEDVDATLLSALFEIDPTVMERAFTALPPAINARSQVEFPWPADPVVEECFEFARTLGYDI